MSVTAGVKRRRRRSTVVSTAVLAVIALVVTGFALRYPGLTSSEIEVSDGGVWVMNEQAGLMGRLNVDASELDARLSTTGEELDILQSGYTVIETGSRGMTPINTAAVQRGGMVETPTNSTVKLGGDRVAIVSEDGKVWILSPDEAAAFSPGGVDPVYTGKDGAPLVEVSTEGTVFVLDGTELLKFPRSEDTRKTTAQKPITVGNVSTTAEMLDLTVVGEQPVILDKENRLLRVGEKVKEYSLTDYGVSNFESALLQQPSPASDDFVLATEDTLFVIPFDGGKAQPIEAGGTGTPVRPAQAKGCAYGAWNQSRKYVRACDGQEPVASDVPEADGDANLKLRVNHDLVILNDQEFGLSWKITEKMEIVEDWVIPQDLQTNEAEEEEKETLTTTVTNIAAEREEENRPPTANDDKFGVRPGKSVVLPVTRNDTDPDGDILVASVDGKQPSIGTVTPIRGGTQLQIVVDDDASGSSSFTYKVNDGRDGNDTATVSLEVREDGSGSEPQAVDKATTKVQVRSGQDVSVNILPYWEDPDGDAFYLTNATTQPEDLVTFQPDGLVTFNDAGLKTGTKQVQLTFRDETGAVGEGFLEIEAVSDTDLAPITTGDHASIVADRTTTIKPLANDLNPNGGALELTNVSGGGSLEVDPVLEAGTINVSGEKPGTYYLEYTVAASGASTASLGIIRVDILKPASEALVPVAVDDMGTVTTGTDTLIDPLENDVDPTGGVLVVNSVDVPENSGLKATVVAHHLIRVEAAPGATVSEEPVPLTYEVANSAGSTQGTARVMLTRTDTQFANPVAVPDQAVVRAGDMVSIDVISNDVSPTGSDLHLGADMESTEADEKGHVEPHQDQIRFRADDDASGETTLTYQVVDETGRDGSARVTITIVPRDAENAPPRPDNLTARTVADTTVRIPVPTSGIDPDGDSVMLTGITSPAPELGEIISANGEWIEYKPYKTSSGTDRFRYQVMDRDGAIGTGEVLVGVAQPTATNQPPYAVDDTIEVRPDRDVQIPVLDNDTDPEGATLSVVREDVEPMTEIETATADEEKTDGVVTVTSPKEPGTHTVLYSASDGALKSPASITIKVDPQAPLRAPIARDDFVPAEDVMDPDAKFVDVDVLANDTDPDGSTKDLTVSLDEASEGAQLRDDIIRVVPQEEQQRLRYLIEDVDGQKSAGYVWVPGTAKQAPVWVGDPLTVQAGSETTVDLSDPANVRVRPGAQGATITDSTLVTAAHSDGSELVKDKEHLVYRPAEDYSGKDSISVPVTDGEVGDANAATSTLAIPVEVTSKDTNLPPTLQGSLLEVEQGGTKTGVDLAATADDPEGDELTYSIGEVPEQEGVTIALEENSTVAATASPGAAKGSIVEVPVSVTDGTNPPVTATVQVTVTGSSKPQLAAVLDVVAIDAGKTDTVNVLDNDSNPFPGGERTVTGAALDSGDGEVTFDGSSVTITPDAEYHGILTAQYTVQDDTGDPDRLATGEIRVTVRGKPEKPSAPRIGEVGDGFVELNFTAGADNGAPITGYKVTSDTGPSVSQECPSTSCTITGLTNDAEYTFQVVATNEVADSEESTPSAVARPDVRPEKPSPPSAERGDTQLTAGWSAPVNRGSAIQRYQLQLQNTSTGEITSRDPEAASTQEVWDGLTNGTEYRFRIRAYNLAEEPSDFSEWSQSEHPAGKPAEPSGTATAERVNDPLGGGITVTWPTMSKAEANGEPITGYLVKSSSGTSQEVGAEETTATFRELDPDAEHTFTYTGVNSVGTGVGASAASNAVVPFAVASVPQGVTASMPSLGTGDGPNGRATVSWKAADGNGTAIKDYVIKGGGQEKVVNHPATSTDISGLTNGKAYTFTVQARNRFEGGESGISKASNSVTPYTTPAKPTLSTSAGTCHSKDECYVNYTVTMPGSDGGKGPKSLKVWIDGKAQTVSGDKFSASLKSASGSKHSLEAEVSNGGGLASGRASTSVTANTYSPPDPKLPTDSWKWGGGTGYVKGCEYGDCRYYGFTLTNLEPGKTYTVSFSNNGQDDYAEVPATGNADGKWTLDPNRFFYGSKASTNNPMIVQVDGKNVGSAYMPG